MPLFEAWLMSMLKNFTSLVPRLVVKGNEDTRLASTSASFSCYVDYLTTMIRLVKAFSVRDINGCVTQFWIQRHDFITSLLLPLQKHTQVQMHDG